MEIRSYLNQSVRNGYLLRWQKMPIQVFIAPMKFYSKQGEDLEYRKLVLTALETWETAGEGLISFNIVDNLLSSQINIDWKRVDRKALGHCQYNYDNLQRLYGAEVSIGLTDGKIHQEYNSKSEVFHTILHELGHALGLGHSPYNTDIMYSPHKYGVVELSENDIYSVQCLYSLPVATPVQQIAAKYSIMTENDIDMVIRKLEEKLYNEQPKETKKSAKPVQHRNNQRNLLDEASNLAEIKKYNLMIQNVGLSKNMHRFFVDKHRENNQ
ncbi:MAG: matrixin family metalloprotease [Candidatus Gastranaerophilales bacterium]|nr:matrixin family metalloprotease [Candidatus Gastranaerophilales bacterium]